LREMNSTWKKMKLAPTLGLTSGAVYSGKSCVIQERENMTPSSFPFFSILNLKPKKYVPTVHCFHIAVFDRWGRHIFLTAHDFLSVFCHCVDPVFLAVEQQRRSGFDTGTSANTLMQVIKDILG